MRKNESIASFAYRTIGRWIFKPQPQSQRQNTYRKTWRKGSPRRQRQKTFIWTKEPPNKFLQNNPKTSAYKTSVTPPCTISRLIIVTTEICYWADEAIQRDIGYHRQQWFTNTCILPIWSFCRSNDDIQRITNGRNKFRDQNIICEKNQNLYIHKIISCSGNCHIWHTVRLHHLDGSDKGADDINRPRPNGIGSRVNIHQELANIFNNKESFKHKIHLRIIMPRQNQTLSTNA